MEALTAARPKWCLIFFLSGCHPLPSPLPLPFSGGSGFDFGLGFGAGSPLPFLPPFLPPLPSPLPYHPFLPPFPSCRRRNNFRCYLELWVQWLFDAMNIVIKVSNLPVLGHWSVLQVMISKGRGMENKTMMAQSWDELLSCIGTKFRTHLSIGVWCLLTSMCSNAVAYWATSNASRSSLDNNFMVGN